MARFLAVLLAVAALLVAGRLGHAAPSTAEVFWRAVLPSSTMPDAVLRLLRTYTSFVSKGMANMAEGAGRSSDLSYGDYKRSSPTAGKATPSNDGYVSSTKGSKARDDTPFSYDYKAPSHLGATASEAGGGGKAASPSKGSKAGNDDDTPFSYDYKARGELGATASEAASGGKATSPSEASKERVSAPYNYSYKAPRAGGAGGGVTASQEERGGWKAKAAVFFHEEAVRVGERLHFRFPAAAPAPLGLLPRHVADSIPFSTRALPDVLALFGVSPGSAQSAGMAETLRTCEWPPLAGEAKFCAASLEALVERAMATLGTRDVRAVTSRLPRAGAPLQLYTVRAVRRVDGASFVACHDEVYPYTVYRCHTTGPARAYMMEMEGAGGADITVATVCHTDTSRWNPEHMSFKMLGTKPGGAPICHLMPYGHIIWAKDVNRSPA